MSKELMMAEIQANACGVWDSGVLRGLLDATLKYTEVVNIIEKHMEGMVIVPERTLRALSDIQTHADSIYSSYTDELETLDGWEMELLFKALTAFEDCP